jgi:cytochrome c peroxidase
VLAAAAAGCWSTTPAEKSAVPAWERENPIKPPAPPPLGMEVFFEDVKPPSPASVRLGRWLFYDTRLSADNTVACASCHKPEFAFSEATPVSTGIKGQKGGRKAPTFINKAVTLAPVFFWDGRAKSLEDQALGPIANPIEMGNTHEVMIATLSRVQGYKPLFQGSLRHRGDR